MKKFNLDKVIAQPSNLINSLMYSSYEENRNNGMTHQQLLSIGLGNDEMKRKYESTKGSKNNLDLVITF